MDFANRVSHCKHLTLAFVHPAVQPLTSYQGFIHSLWLAPTASFNLNPYSLVVSIASDDLHFCRRCNILHFDAISSGDLRLPARPMMTFLCQHIQSMPVRFASTQSLLAKMVLAMVVVIAFRYGLRFLHPTVHTQTSCQALRSFIPH